MSSHGMAHLNVRDTYPSGNTLPLQFVYYNHRKKPIFLQISLDVNLPVCYKHNKGNNNIVTIDKSYPEQIGT